MAHVDGNGAIETYEEPPLRFVMCFDQPDPVARTVARLIARVRRGGVGSFCVSYSPKPHEARVRVELLEGDRIHVVVTGPGLGSDYVVESAR